MNDKKEDGYGLAVIDDWCVSAILNGDPLRVEWRHGLGRLTGYKVARCDYNIERRAFVALIRHPDLPEFKEGYIAPVVVTVTPE